MFTGIVEEIGTIKSIKKGAKSETLTIAGDIVLKDAKVGDSIAVNGICLTVTSITGNTFTADVMAETMRRTALSKLPVGCYVNLERAMAADGRFGGHIVSGHIDGTGEILKLEKEDNAVWVTIKADSNILKYIIEKGSITIDGISLTVAYVNDSCFKVSIIPHTATNTTLLSKKAGDMINLENDVIAKYVEKLLLHKDRADYDAKGSRAYERSSGIDEKFLTENGFM